MHSNGHFLNLNMHCQPLPRHMFLQLWSGVFIIFKITSVADYYTRATSPHFACMRSCYWCVAVELCTCIHVQAWLMELSSLTAPWWSSFQVPETSPQAGLKRGKLVIRSSRIHVHSELQPDLRRYDHYWRQVLEPELTHWGQSGFSHLANAPYGVESERH
jgi:hypothetical protein